MNIGVAVLATLSDIGEDGFHVTLRTSHGLMHAAQWITGLVVIEFGNGADRLPGTRRVAVLAWDVKVSVGTLRDPAGNLRPGCCRIYRKSYQANCYECECPSP